jgi:hypothetical protein
MCVYKFNVQLRYIDPPPPPCWPELVLPMYGAEQVSSSFIQFISMVMKKARRSFTRMSCCYPPPSPTPIRVGSVVYIFIYVLFHIYLHTVRCVAESLLIPTVLNNTQPVSYDQTLSPYPKASTEHHHISLQPFSIKALTELHHIAPSALTEQNDLPFEH